MSDSTSAFAGDRLAKVIARAGLCSRRDAELWIKEGRVAVNGKIIRTPAFNVTDKDKIKVDGQQLQARQGTRVWLYHKPQGLVVTEKDPEGRGTVFETLEQQGLPRVVSIGRLDINTEGLLLLTNDGGLKRVLELPATGWLRRYRVRAFGAITQAQLDGLKDGIEIDGIQYGPIEAVLEREQGSNVWLVLSLREGKNREVKNVLGALGLQVNRLIRVSFGPFQLGDLPIGAVEVVKARILREQLGARLANEAGVDFDSELPEPAAIKLARGAANPALRAARPGAEPPKQRRGMADRTERFRFADRPDRERSEHDPSKAPMRKDRPGSRDPRRPPLEKPKPEIDAGPPRKIFREDGTEADFVEKTYGKKPKPSAKDFGDKPPFKRDAADRPKRPYSPRPGSDSPDRPKRDFGSRGSSTAERGRGTGAAGGGGGRSRDADSRPPRGDFGDRPKRPYTGRPATDGADRPKRSFGSRVSSPENRGRGTGEAGGGGGRGRNFGDRPTRADAGDRPKRPYAPRPGSDSPDRPKRSFGDKPRGPRPDGDKPKRPRGSGPGGDRPRRPRPPKA
ncbi:MAG: pseudouridine synthase [Devosia sp.]